MTIQPKKRPKAEPPVAWLLGRDLIASLQGTLLYTAFGSKLDPRAWMKAEKINLTDHITPEANEYWFDYIADTGDGMKATYSIAYLAYRNLHLKEDLEKIPRDAEIRVKLKKDNEDKMILPRGDFLLVGGDTSYHLSDYATLGTRFYKPFRWAFEDLWNDLGALNTDEAKAEQKNLEKRRSLFGIPGNHDYYDQLDGFRRQFRRPVRPEENGDLSKHLPEADNTDVPELMLPGFRCEQSASYIGLQLPFGWWLWGLDTEVGLIDPQQRKFFLDLQNEMLEPEMKNYKMLSDKYKRWKDKPSGDEPENPGEEPKRKDFPKKLILATCSPTTFFGRFAEANDKKSAEAIAQLELSQPFLPKKKEGNETLSERTGDAIMKDGQCRLDLSGDYHLYARYWGPESERENPRENTEADRPHANSYASVISGLGGAFHHPSQTFHNDLQEQALYPSETNSRTMFSKRLFSFQNVFKGGGVGYIGFCLAFIIYFTATVPDSSKQAVENALGSLPFGLSQTQKMPIRKTVNVLPAQQRNETANNPQADNPNTAKPQTETPDMTSVAPVDTPQLWQILFNSPPEWNPNEQKPKAPVSGKCNKAPFFFGPCHIEAPGTYWISVGLIIAGLIIFIVAVISFAMPRKVSEIKQNNEKQEIGVTIDPAMAPEFAKFQTEKTSKAQTEKKSKSKAPVISEDLKTKAAAFGDFIGSYTQLIFFGLTVASALLLLVGLITIKPYRGLITPFGQSMLVFATGVWAVAAVILSIIYSDWLFKQASIREIRRRDWVLTWSLLILGAIIVSSGLWWFATNNTPAYIITDITLVLATAGMAILIILLAVKVGGTEHSWRRGKAGFLLLGLWHAILQICVPYLLVRKGSWLAVGFAVLASVGFWLVGRWLMKINQGGWLVFFWFIYGVILLLLPYISFEILYSNRDYISYNGFEEMSRSIKTAFGFGAKMRWYEEFLIFPGLAGIVGLFASCIWLGWYLAICLYFNAHNNEAGGAGRIEQFKEFIRFRVRENDITGYVIGIDEPKEKGSELQPKLIDVFTLKVKNGASNAG